MTFFIDEIITKIIIENTLGQKYACNITYLSTFQVRVTVVFLDDISIIFIDKTDPKDPITREHYWWHTLNNGTSRFDCRG